VAKKEKKNSSIEKHTYAHCSELEQNLLFFYYFCLVEEEKGEEKSKATSLAGIPT
jgi:hypothetical protein